MKWKKVKYLLVELFLFIVQIALSREFFGQIFPFGFVFALVRIYLEGNLLAVTIEYAVSNIFIGANFFMIVSVAFEIIVLSLYYFCNQTIKIKRKKLVLSLFLLLSSAVKLYLTITGNMFYVDFLLELGLKIVSLFYFLKLHEIYRKKFTFFKCGNLDYLFFSVFVVIFVLGAFKYELLRRSVGIFLFLSALFISCRFLPIDRFLVFSITLILCFGHIYSSINLIIYSLISVIILLAIARVNKYFFLSFVLAGGFLMLQVIGQVNLSNVLNLGASVVFVALIPQKLISKFISFFEEKQLNVINENLWQEKQNEIKSNLTIMSKTLSQMQEDFKFLIVGKIDRKNASEELAKDVIKNCCEMCDRRFICSSSIIDKQRILAEFIHFAIMNESFSVDQLSIGFRTYCDKTMLVASNIASLAGRYLQFETSIKTEDESKLLISSELGNFAKLFQNFAKNMEKSPKINKNLSNILKEMLINNMIDVLDVAVFENRQGIEKIDIVAENAIVMKREFGVALSRFVRHRVQVRKIQHLELSGLSLISFVISNELSAEFAVSCSSKEKINGDNTMIAKIDDNRFFVAIADGMGHGKLAGKTSQMILGLIKNMFLIGINLELIIETVNKLLIPVGLDNFSTLDVAIIDLNQSKCCFVKLGSSVSAIKHVDTTEIVSAASLPVGIIQNLSPTIETRKIQAGDILILSSDGVVDSFKDIEEYRTFVNDSKIAKLQQFTDNLIFELGAKANKHLDDMSIIAVKLLKNSQK